MLIYEETLYCFGCISPVAQSCNELTMWKNRGRCAKFFATSPKVAKKHNPVTKIENYAIEQPTFFGVGAGHLAGEFGLIQLLKNKGYTVTPVF